METTETGNVVSQKKIEANRRNALRSTGPRTLRGKRKVRWNAIKYGLLSRQTLVRTGAGKESESEFRDLLGQVRRDCQPVGFRQEMLVEKIAICYWRLRRALRYEAHQLERPAGGKGWSQVLARLVETKLSELRRPEQAEGAGPDDSRQGQEPQPTAPLIVRLLPPEHEIKKILGYESSIEHQLYRALNQLERLQRQRN